MICEKCGYDNCKKMSSNQQRRAYFGLAVNRLAEHYGYEPQIMHKALAGGFFGFVDVKVGSMTFKVPASTTGRTTKEFCDFFAWIQKIGADVGVYIQSPNEPPLVDPT